MGCYGGSTSHNWVLWGQSPQRGTRGRAPGGRSGGRSPAEADGILVLEHTFFCAVLELVVVADLTEATRQAYI